MAYCPSCGAEVSPTSQFCENCGSSLDSTASTEPVADSPPVEEEVQPETEPVQTGGQPKQGPFGFALSYPSASGWGPILKGGILVFLSILILPAFIVFGYFVRIAAAAAQKQEEPPPMTDWGGLFSDGLRAFAVFLPLLIAVWILAFVTIRVNPVLYLVVTLVFSYVFPALAVNYSVERTFASAYDVELLGNFAFTGYYVKNFLVYIGLAIVLTIIALISAITIVAVPFVYFFMYAAFSSFWGRVYHSWSATST